MLTKEEFVGVMKKLEREGQFWDEQNKLYRKYNDILLDGVAPLPLISDTVLFLLEDIFGLDRDERYGSTISWWFFDCECGNNKECVESLEYSDKEGNKLEPPCLPYTAENLYDLLIWESETFRKDKE